MPDRRDSAAILDDLLTEPGIEFALLYRPSVAGSDVVDVLVGRATRVDALADIPVPDAAGDETLVVVPFRAAAERGMECHDDGEPVLAMRVDTRARISLADALDRLPDAPVSIVDGGFDLDDATYGDIVRRVIEDEIGTGQGSNFVINRAYTGRIADYSLGKAATVFRRLVEQEQGAYWTFLVHTAEATFVGASPERHVTLEDGIATMNPISGTYRYPASGATADGLIEFLADGKESDELYMVLDEELKMMGAVCEQGARVIGPQLRGMAHLAHTEYLISGRTTRGPIDVLRHTLFAPTVVGSPLENAFRVIRKHERSGRGYYSGVAALLSRDATGGDVVDSAILIRTATIRPDGSFRIGAGSTLVRHSRAESEAAETRAKAQSLLTAMNDNDRRAAAGAPAPLPVTAEVEQALAERNSALNDFWFADEDARLSVGHPQLAGYRMLLVDNEDTFTSMLAHHLRSLGLDTEIRRYDDAYPLSEFDVVLVGPGPGDPRCVDDGRIAQVHKVVGDLLATRQPFLAVCLGHQVLSHQLGLELVPRETPDQGVQHLIDLFGVPERVGFYNTYVARSDVDSFTSPAGTPVRVSRDRRTGEVNALRGGHFTSLQFHLESVLTQHGRQILADALVPVLGSVAQATGTAA
jgi:phenazine biosynthesis protein phzE